MGQINYYHLKNGVFEEIEANIYLSDHEDYKRIHNTKELPVDIILPITDELKKRIGII